MGLLRKVAFLIATAGVCCVPLALSDQVVVGDVIEGLPDEVELEIESVDDDLLDFARDSKNAFLTALYNLSDYLPLSVEYAYDVSGTGCDVRLLEFNQHFYSTVGLCIAAALLILGVVFGFFGYRLMKIVLFLIGFAPGATLTYLILLTYLSSRDESWVLYVSIAASAVVGAICGIITICVYYIGIFLAGGAIGFLSSWFILSAIDYQYFAENIWVPVLISLAFAVIVGVITLLVQKWFFMVGTSVLGAFAVVWGLDYYLELGYMIYFLFLFAEHRDRITPCWYSWTVLGLFVVVAVCGFVIQAAVTGRKYDHKKALKGVCCGMCKKCKKQKKKVTDDEKELLEK